MLSLLVTACGGGGGGSSSGASATGTTASSGTSVSTGGATTSATCSLRNREDWVAAQMREWYLFPETLPASLDPTPYASVSDYLDALTATARSQRRDRYFTYLTSIASEDAYYSTGSSAGFGIRLATNVTAGTVTVTEAFENTPALAAGIDRGTQILEIGTSMANTRTVAAILASDGAAGITDALGPSAAGTTRVLRVSDARGNRYVTVAKADYTLDPVSSRYGAKILTGGARPVGYVNLRTFITTADPALRAAFLQFRSAGITDFIVDLRYNGGGLVSIAQLMGDLLGGNRATSDILSQTVFRPEKSSSNETRRFQPQPQSTSPLRIAFIGTGATASASELVINAMIPYLHANVALIGANTYGKPVGQIALDRAQCDDRLRVIAFATQNAAGGSGYFDGLASVVETSCAAADNYAVALGDPAEDSIRAANDFLFGRSCSRIAGGITTQAVREGGRNTLLIPDRPDSTSQRELPGAF